MSKENNNTNQLKKAEIRSSSEKNNVQLHNTVSEKQSLTDNTKQVTSGHSIRFRDSKTYIIKDDSYLKAHSLGNRSSEKIIDIIKSVIPQSYSSNYVASYLIGNDSNAMSRTYDQNVNIIAQSLINKAKRLSLPIDSFSNQSLPLFSMVLRYMADPKDPNSSIIEVPSLQDMLSSVNSAILDMSHTAIVDRLSDKFSDKAQTDLEAFLNNLGIDDSIRSTTIERYKSSLCATIANIIRPYDIERELDSDTKRYILSLIKSGDLALILYGLVNNKELSDAILQKLKNMLYNSGAPIDVQNYISSWLNSIEKSEKDIFFNTIAESTGFISTKDKSTIQSMMLAIHDMTSMSDEVYKYIGQIHQLCDASFSNIEKIASSFENACRLIGTAKDLEVGQAYLENFMNSNLFSRSIVSHLYNICSYGSLRSNDMEDISIREDLRNKLVSIINGYSSANIARISVSGVSNISSDFASVYSPINTNVEIDFFYNPSIELSDTGAVNEVNGASSSSVMQDASNGNLSFGLSVKDLFSLRCIRLSGDDKFFKAASGNFKSADFISHVQFPVFIKDVLLNKIRTIAFIIESLLALKQQALYDVLEVQQLAISDIGSALLTVSQVDAVSNYSHAYNDTATKVDKYINDLVSKHKLSSEYAFRQLDSHIPIFNLSYDAHSKTKSSMTIDGLSESFRNCYKSLLALACRYDFIRRSVHDEKREPFIAYRHESVLASRKIKNLDYLMNEFFKISPNHDNGIIPDSYYQNIISSAELIKDGNVFLSSNGLEYFSSIRINRGLDSTSSKKKNLFELAAPLSIGEMSVENQISSYELVDLANSFWAEYFNVVSYDKMKLFENIRKIEINFGPYIIPLLKFACSPFDGVSLGYTVERYDLNLGAKFIHNDELLLDKLLGMVGLNSRMILNYNEFESVHRLISSQSGNSSFPFIISGSWSPGASLGDVIDLNPLWNNSSEGAGSEDEFFETRHVYLRSDDLIEMMLSDSILIKHNYQVKVIRYDKSPVMIGDNQEITHMYLDIFARCSAQNYFLFNELDLNRLTKNIVTELRDGVLSILGYKDLETKLKALKPDNIMSEHDDQNGNNLPKDDFLSRLRSKLSSEDDHL